MTSTPSTGPPNRLSRRRSSGPNLVPLSRFGSLKDFPATASIHRSRHLGNVDEGHGAASVEEDVAKPEYPSSLGKERIGIRGACPHLWRGPSRVVEKCSRCTGCQYLIRPIQREIVVKRGRNIPSKFVILENLIKTCHVFGRRLDAGHGCAVPPNLGHGCAFDQDHLIGARNDSRIDRVDVAPHRGVGIR